MTPVTPFADVLEAADHLSADEQEELIAVLQRRLAAAARKRLVADIQEARLEHSSGRCSPASPQQIMDEISK
ncbi:MAG: hypothetical protein U0793_02420 [Gemmataceae bacterium]